MSENPIEALMNEIVGDNFVTHYVVVMEVMTQEGIDLRVGTSENMTTWQALGMMDVASDMIASGALEWQNKEDDE